MVFMLASAYQTYYTKVHVERHRRYYVKGKIVVRLRESEVK